MAVCRSQLASPSRKRRWLQFSLRTLLVFVTLCSVACGWLAGKMLTFPWEVSWIKSATSLTLRSPEETLSGADLRKFLEGFGCDNSRQMDWRCTLSRRTGQIGMDGNTYSVELLQDKFLGDVLVVRRQWKTVEVFRSRCNIQKIGNTGQPRRPLSADQLDSLTPTPPSLSRQ